MTVILRNGRLQKSIRWIQRRFEPPNTPKALVLMYHRICETNFDPWSLCVEPKNFRDHLKAVREYAHPVSLQQLFHALQNQQIPQRAIAITFDDGYADNLYNAMPLLEKYNIPATVFVATGYIGTQRDGWWDELSDLLLRPRQLPETLTLAVGNRRYSWSLGQARHYLQAEHQHDQNKELWEAKPNSRLHVCYSVSKFLKSLPYKEQYEVIDQLRVWACTEADIPLSHRFLTWDELRTLAQRNIMEIGAHTITHPSLPNYSAKIQQNEIQRSKEKLEQILNCSVSSFAYPFGEYERKTIQLVQNSKFSLACSTLQDSVRQGVDVFQLPRFEVRNWDKETFSKKLLQWFEQ